MEPRLNDNVAEIQMVTFCVEEEKYAVSVSEVKEIILPMGTFPIPGMRDPVKGVINLRGEIVPVLDIHSILGVPKTTKESPSNKRRYIILDSGDGGFGFEVDRVMEVVKFGEDRIQPSPEIGRVNINNDILNGIIQSGNEIIIVIDPLKLIKSCMDIGELAKARSY